MGGLRRGYCLYHSSPIQSTQCQWRRPTATVAAFWTCGSVSGLALNSESSGQVFNGRYGGTHIMRLRARQVPAVRPPRHGLFAAVTVLLKGPGPRGSSMRAAALGAWDASSKRENASGSRLPSDFTLGELRLVSKRTLCTVYVHSTTASELN
jgi:hypothetical protein